MENATSFVFRHFKGPIGTVNVASDGKWLALGRQNQMCASQSAAKPQQSTRKGATHAEETRRRLEIEMLTFEPIIRGCLHAEMSQIDQRCRLIGTGQSNM